MPLVREDVLPLPPPVQVGRPRVAHGLLRGSAVGQTVAAVWPSPSSSINFRIARWIFPT